MLIFILVSKYVFIKNTVYYLPCKGKNVTKKLIPNQYDIHNTMYNLIKMLLYF